MILFIKNFLLVDKIPQTLAKFMLMTNQWVDIRTSIIHFVQKILQLSGYFSFFLIGTLLAVICDQFKATILQSKLTQTRVFEVVCFIHLGSISSNYFRVNLLTLFCKLDHFINIGNIYGIFMERSSLQNRVSKFMPKSFMRSTHGCALWPIL